MKQSTNKSINPSIHLRIYPFTNLSIYRPIHQTTDTRSPHLKEWNILPASAPSSSPSLKTPDAPGHDIRSHAEPSNPFTQAHSPVIRSQVPMSEHSVRVRCAVLSAVGLENQDLPLGQVLREQSAPCQVRLCVGVKLNARYSTQRFDEKIYMVDMECARGIGEQWFRILSLI